MSPPVELHVLCVCVSVDEWARRPNGVNIRSTPLPSDHWERNAVSIEDARCRAITVWRHSIGQGH